MRLRTTTTLLVALAAVLAAGCGSDEEQGDPIPAQAAVDLESRLAEVERRMTAGGGACGDITNDSAPAVAGIIESLPENVDPDVRQALQDGFERLFALTDEQCDAQAGQDTTPDDPTTETETEPTETEEPAPTETEPAPTETDEEPPPDEVPPDVPPGQDGENPGQGVGGGAVTPGEEGDG